MTPEAFAATRQALDWEFDKHMERVIAFERDVLGCGPDIWESHSRIEADEIACKALKTAYDSGIPGEWLASTVLNKTLIQSKSRSA